MASLNPVPAASPRALSAVDLKPLAEPFPSPIAWRDQILYFLLPDRFSDGLEAGKPMYDRNNPLGHAAPDKAAWMHGGTIFQGGKIKGIQDKLGYLKGLGITTLWVGPVWKQRPDLETYHGYGIQDFLEVDPRFGTRQDLRDLIDDAHSKGIYVILDIIFNHSGNNWYYDNNGTRSDMMDYRYQPPYPVLGWHSATGQSVAAIASNDDGVWPQEFQNFDWYTKAGKIQQWDPAIRLRRIDCLESDVLQPGGASRSQYQWRSTTWS